MDKLKQTILIGVVGFLVVFAGGWFFLVSPQRSNVSSLNADTTTQNQKNATLQTQIAQLKSESVDGVADQATLAAIARRLPSDLAETTLITSLSHAAAEANVDLQAITPGTPVLDTVAAPAAVLTSTAAATTTSSGSAATGVLPHVAVNTEQLYSIPLSLTVVGDYFDVEMFVHNLEGMQRALLIGQLTLAKAATATGTLPVASAGATLAANPTAITKVTVKTKVSSKSVAGGKKSSTKLVPGSPQAAQAAANAAPPFVADVNDLTLTISATVFSMYDTAPLPALVAPTTAPATPSPTK